MPIGQRSTETHEILILGFRLIILERAKQGISGQGISCALYFTENKGLNRGLSTECWDIQHIPVLPKMLVFKLIFSRQKIKILFSEQSKLKDTNSEFKTNKQKCPIRLLSVKFRVDNPSLEKELQFTSVFFFPQLTSWGPVLECRQSI